MQKKPETEADENRADGTEADGAEAMKAKADGTEVKWIRRRKEALGRK